MPDEEITIQPDDVVEVKASDLILPDEPKLVVHDGEEHAALDMAKLKCVEGESDEEHAAHKGELEAAYAAFASRAGAGSESNPAPSGETTNIEAHATMAMEGEV
jgi:hypothetical protein